MLNPVVTTSISKHTKYQSLGDIWLFLVIVDWNKYSDLKKSGSQVCELQENVLHMSLPFVVGFYPLSMISPLQQQTNHS